ncbi:MAG: 2-oxoacid:acceptor oxidoreductase family protein, partial [Deferrisomatales bacterium]
LWELVRQVTPHLHPVALEDLAKHHFGDLRRVNVLALGLASALGDLPVSDEALLAVVRERLPDFDGNRRAFDLGRDAAGPG